MRAPRAESNDAAPIEARLRAALSGIALRIHGSSGRAHPARDRRRRVHQFSRLLRRVAAGEEITIANRGVPVARLVPVPPKKAQRVLGIYRGQFSVPDDFDAPLPNEILDLFGRRQPKKRKRS